MMKKVDNILAGMNYQSAKTAKEFVNGGLHWVFAFNPRPLSSFLIYQLLRSAPPQSHQ